MLTLLWAFVHSTDNSCGWSVETTKSAACMNTRSLASWRMDSVCGWASRLWKLARLRFNYCMSSVNLDCRSQAQLPGHELNRDRRVGRPRH